LTHEIVDGVCTIFPVGVLDAHTSEQLDALVDKVMEGGILKIVCTLDKVTYIASAGVGVFVGYVNTCKEKGGDLVLVHPSGWGMGEAGSGLSKGYNVLEVFNLLGLSEFISVATSREAALALFAGG
jgi:anti-sigma B factor antagonist